MGFEKFDWRSEKVRDSDFTNLFKAENKLKIPPECTPALLASFAGAALWLYYNQNF
jgi:hypothetical protein